jgi:hypothetical protein
MRFAWSGRVGRIPLEHARTIGDVRSCRRIVAGVSLGLMLAACAEPTTEPSADGLAQEPADVARVTCDADGTHIETASVSARPDGVHLVVVNHLGFDTGFSFELSDGSGGGDNSPRGTSTHVLQAPPGQVLIGCYLDPDASGEVERQTFEVVDADGVYRPTELDCESISVGTSDYAAGATGESGDPVDLGRQRFDGAYGLQEGDVVERAGYPQADLQTVRLVRDGRVLATITYRGSEAGGWLEETMATCEDLQLA